MKDRLTETENAIFEMARPYLKVMGNEIHTEEVVRFCLRLLAEEAGDRSVVIPAAILHDVGWSQLPENLSVKVRIHNHDPEKIRIHEEMGARIAAEILGKMSESQARMEAILSIISGHDSRKTALSLNDKIVKDADKLSRYSRRFFQIWASWGGNPDRAKYVDVLKKNLDEWFFLPASIRMAREELNERLMEFQDLAGKADVNTKVIPAWEMDLSNLN